jgi:hypothetical protein
VEKDEKQSTILNVGTIYINTFKECKYVAAVGNFTEVLP